MKLISHLFLELISIYILQCSDLTYNHGQYILDFFDFLQNVINFKFQTVLPPPPTLNNVVSLSRNDFPTLSGGVKGRVLKFKESTVKLIESSKKSKYIVRDCLRAKKSILYIFGLMVLVNVILQLKRICWAWLLPLATKKLKIHDGGL